MIDHDRITEITSKLLTMFESGELPQAVARTVIVRSMVNRPSDHWSLTNRLIMWLVGMTEDARGFRQWQQANRQVIKGAKAFYILAPLQRTIRQEMEDLTTGQKEVITRNMITGFRAVPVFRLEDTEGEPVPDQDYSPAELPPLYDLALRYGEVKYMPMAGAYGAASPDGTIFLGSHDVDVFFHELAHQVHRDIRGSLKPGQHSDQELVAEMSACVLCELYGYSGYLRQGWDYMKYYSDKDPLVTLKAIIAVLNEVEEVLINIISQPEARYSTREAI